MLFVARPLHRPLLRAFSTSPAILKSAQQSLHPTTGSNEPYPHEKPPLPPQGWLTRKLKESPAAMKTFLAITNALGYGSKKQVAARRAYAMYEALCTVRAEEERAFWQNECDLPPTFQSWFTVTNLHVWLLVTRLRGLPHPHGVYFVQGIIDHFFLDVEERVRAILQPATPTETTPLPATPSSKFTVDSPAPPSPQDPHPRAPFYSPTEAKRRVRGRAPERLVSQQMKIFKEQYTGMGLALDLGLTTSDAVLAAAAWRNLLGARGARGIVYPASLAPAADADADAAPYFRRHINLVGGEVERVAAVDRRGLEAEEARDDGSGVHDYAPAAAGRYVRYPELMADLVRYVRREVKRLEGISDEDVRGPSVVGREGEGILKMRFGPIRA